MSITTVITNSAEIGGVFLSWSLYWLSGDVDYYYYKQQKSIPLPDNPLTDINAHGFKPNQPIKYSQVKECFEILKSVKTSNHHVYFHKLPENDKEAIDIAFDESSKCILLNLSLSHNLYFMKNVDRVLTFKINSTEKHKNFEEQKENFINLFFDESKKYWEETLKMNEIWDKREFLALNLRPYSHSLIDDINFYNREYFLLTTNEHFNTLDVVIPEIFNFIGAKIKKDRWHGWKDKYQTWKQIHYDRVNFSCYFDEIIHAILNGINLDLKRFKLDIYREATIQHVLLYKYNLNFKTYGLEKFENTLQLHNLLESNIHHKLEKIY